MLLQKKNYFKKSDAAIRNLSNHNVIALLEGSLRDAINSSEYSQVTFKSLSSYLDLKQNHFLKMFISRNIKTLRMHTSRISNNCMKNVCIKYNYT